MRVIDVLAGPGFLRTMADDNRSKIPEIQAASKEFARFEGRIREVPEAELLPRRVDVGAAVSITLAAIVRLKDYRDALVALPETDAKHLDELEGLALAAWYADVVAMPEEDAPDASKTLLAEARPLRKAMLADAESAAARGILDAARVQEIRSGRGSVDVANDAVALASLFQENWDAIKDGVFTSEEEIERAAELGSQLLVALAREAGNEKPPTVADALKVREQAFTLLSKSYEECRRAIQYVRYHAGDASRIAPSFYAGRRKTAPVDDEAPEASGSGVPV